MTIYCSNRDLLSIWDYQIVDDELSQVAAANLRHMHTKTDLLFQNLSYSTDIFKNILAITNFKGKLADEYKEHQAEVFVYVFRFLEWMYFKNPVLKQSTYKAVVEIIDFVEVYQKCQCRFLLFMREWTKDNEKLVYDSKSVLLCFKKLLNILNDQLDPVSTIGGLILSTLPNLLMYKGTYLKENQNELLRLLFSKKYRAITESSTGLTALQTLKSIATTQESFSKIHTVEKTKVMVLHVEVRFIIHFLRLLSACTEQKNSYTVRFCQKLFEPSLIEEMIKLPQATFDLKCTLVDFLLYSSLRSEPLNTLNTIYIATRLMPFLVQEFALSVKTLLDQSEEYAEMSDVVVISESSCEIFEVLVENYVLKLGEIFEEMADLEILEQQYLSFATSLNQSLLTILEILEKSISKFSVELRKRFTSFLTKIIKSPSVKYFPDLKTSAEEIERKHNLLSDELIVLNSNKLKPDPDAKTVTMNMQSIITELMVLSKTDKFEQCQRENFEKICGQLERVIEEESERQPTLHEIGCSLLETLASKDCIDRVDWQAYSFAICLLQFYLDKTGEDSDLQVTRQNQLIELGCVENIVKILCFIDNEVVRQYAVNFVIAVLDNGNPLAQERFEKIVTGDDDDGSNSILTVIGHHIGKKVHELDSICKKIRKEKLERQFAEASFEKQTLQVMDHLKRAKIAQSCEAYFRMLQLFCEGHNDGMQSLMLAQKGESQSHNFLETCIAIYGTFLMYLDQQIKPMVLQCLTFLVESIQGPNRANQQFVFKSKYFEYFNDYVAEFEEALEEKDEERIEILSDTVQKSVTVISSLLEGNTCNKSVYYELQKYVNVRSLLRILVNDFETYFKDHIQLISSTEQLLNTIQNKTFDDELLEMFEVFFLIKYMNINLSSSDTQLRLGSLAPNEERCYRFFDRCSGSIEISFQGSLELIFFIKHPATSYLSEEQKTAFLDEVRRDSITNKLIDLQIMSSRLIMLMDYNNYSSRSGGTVIKTSKTIFTYINVAIVTFVFLVMILVFMTDDYNIETFLSLKSGGSLLQAARSLLLILCLIRVIVSCIYLGPLHLKEEWSFQYRRFSETLQRLVSFVLQDED